MKEEQLAKIEQDLGRRDLADHILFWDRKQGRDSEDAQVCQYDKSHGRLQMHGHGQALICCAGRGNDKCRFPPQPVSR